MTEQLELALEPHAGSTPAPPPGPDREPPDVDARRRIRDDIDANLFVEAGAGAGKTSALVGRIVHLVGSGVPITAIAAITFTEKAAAELRARVRDELEHAEPEVCDPHLVSTAVGQLDHAPIGTLHAFARRILFEFPIEAGIPPGFGVLDELESNLAFDERWEELLDALLGEAAPDGGILAGGRELVELCEYDMLDIKRGVRAVAADFHDNWDLVEACVSLDDPGPLPLDARAVRASAQSIIDAEVPPGDTQECHQAELATAAAELDAAEGTRQTMQQLLALRKVARTVSTRGAKSKWGRHGGEDALEAHRRRGAELVEQIDAVDTGVKAYRRLVLGAILGRFVLDAAHERARSGGLEFHDLLVLARRLIANRPEVRTALHQRYQRVLLDEFQDTDPIQLEIAVRLTADPDDVAHVADWRSLHPLPGRLFIVGDPKQSIYRFRRADIAQYLRAGEQLPADRVVLSANFRSTRAVIDAANELFARIISHEPGAQPAFHALEACRRAALLDHGSVTVLGADLHDDLEPGSWSAADGRGIAEELRRREAADVVGAVTAALREGWPVGEGAELRPCRPGDICILLPSRLSLGALENALADAAVPYRAENSSVVYTAAEVRDLLLLLRAADDPTDRLALVASLRSPLYGCSDVELFDWVRRDGRWSIWWVPPDDLADHPVARAIAHVRSIAERIGSVAPADLLAAVADERRVFDLALDRPDRRDVWRRLRFVIEQARAWADAGGHGVRRYLAWCKLQASDGRIAETILPEHDADAVRIMTVHASKGLEFPITIVGGMTTQPSGNRGTRAVFSENDWMLTGSGDDGRFDAYKPIDEQMSDAERRRLLYVACTRAVDHLVVSIHRAVPKSSNADYADETALTSAELLAKHDAASVGSSRSFHPEPLAPPERTPLELDWSDPEAWAREREGALRVAGRRSTVAATRLVDDLHAEQVEVVEDPGLDKRPVNLDLAPWRRGRYGTSIGRAVHGVLQFCDLATGHDIATLARAQCAAEGIIGLDDRVAALARSAIQAPLVRSVVDGAPHWRELFVAAPIGSRLLEGYVDLLVRTPDGLVIVDYKTDRWSGPAQTGERVARYRVQLAAYGVALEQALGEPISGGVLIRCIPDTAAEQIRIADWAEALDEVRTLVS